MNRLQGLCRLGWLTCALSLSAQVIEFDSNGLKYQTLSRSGVTVMFAHLQNHVHEYSILQVAVSNGSRGPYTIRPENFSYEWEEGAAVHAVSAKTVIAMLMQKGNSADLVKLITAYEASVYGNPHMRSTNGYEARRRSALGMNATKLKAAAAASAVALVETRLAPAESTDGALFFPSDGRPLTGGKLVVRTNTDVFQFNTD